MTDLPLLTRRTVLAGVAGAGAASLLAPVSGVAATLGGRAVYRLTVGSVIGESAVLRALRPFQLVGVEWSSPGNVRIELRTRAHGNRFSGWVPASSLGHTPDQPPTPGRLFGEGVWTGPADFVQLRATPAAWGVRLVLVTADKPETTAVAAAAPQLASPVLDAGPGQPPIIAREVWAGGHAPPRVPPSYGTVRLAFVHHTDSVNSYSPDEVPGMLLSIYRYHLSEDFDDIGYNFVIDLFGRIWEARAGGIDLPVIGAQAGGYNAVSTGVAILGNFTEVVPSRAALASLEHLLAWKLSLHGVPALGQVGVQISRAGAKYTGRPAGTHLLLPRIAGHRQGDATECPGNAFYYDRLPGVRSRVAAMVGTPAKLTLAARPRTLVGGGVVALSGRLTRLSGSSMSGASIELQQVGTGGERTLASAVTGADGSWSATVTVSRNMLLRALHRPAPASTSLVIFIGVEPRVTLSVESVSPLRVRGTVAPATRRVTIEVFSLRGGHRRVVMRKRVGVAVGRFSARLRIRRPGRYAVRAITAADARNVPGSSPEIPVTA